MKAIFISYSMVIATLAMFLSFCWYIQYEHAHSVIELAVKRSLKSTMVDFIDQSNFEAQDVFNTFESYFKEITLEDYDYEITLSGFLKEPLFMRVNCKVTNDSKLKGLQFEVDEAMIEEVIE